MGHTRPGRMSVSETSDLPAELVGDTCSGDSGSRKRTRAGVVMRAPGPKMLRISGFWGGVIMSESESGFGPPSTEGAKERLSRWVERTVMLRFSCGSGFVGV